MSVYLDTNGKWACRFHYRDNAGQRREKHKKGFKLKRDAVEFERDFLQNLQGQPEMSFAALCELYINDKKALTKVSTYETKKNRIENWILPYFKDKPIKDITPAMIRNWQVNLKQTPGANGKPLSPGYMQNIVTEMSGIMNYAVKFYALPSNPCHVAGNAVGKKQKSITFWTKEEFDRFIDTFDHADPYYTVFNILYYTGLRKGELQALTPDDIDLDQGVIHITKTYRFSGGQVHIMPPKTEKSKRDVLIPRFLGEIIRDYESRFYGLKHDDMLFCFGKTTYSNHLNAHADQAGVKRIRVHDLRHSHASLLIYLGFNAPLVSERLGHESVSTTLDIYTHLFPSKQTEVIERLEKINQLAHFGASAK